MTEEVSFAYFNSINSPKSCIRVSAFKRGIACIESKQRTKTVVPQRLLVALCVSCHYLLAGTLAQQAAGTLAVCVALRSTLEGNRNI